MMRFISIMILIFLATFSIAGESDVVITTTENEIYLCVGEYSALTVFANDSTSEIIDFHYQWFYSTTSILTTNDGWTEIDGANNDTLSFENILAETSVRNAGYYYCKVYYGLDYMSTSNSEIFIVRVTQQIAVYPPLNAALTACSGSDTAISIADLIYVGATHINAEDFDNEGITIAWHRQGETEIVSTEPYLHFSNLQDDDAGRYVCDVTNSCGTITDGPVTVSVVPTPDMTLGPDLNSCSGDTIVIGPQGDVEYEHYSWNYGTYGYQPTLEVLFGGTYILEVRNTYECTAIDTVHVVLHDYFDIQFDSTPIVNCSEFVLDAGEGATAYIWNTTDNTNSITVNRSGYYTVTVDGDGYGCTSSMGVSVTISEINAEIIEPSISFCDYDGDINAIPAETGEGFWSSSEPDLISFDDSTNPNTIVHTTDLNNDSPYTVYWTVRDGDCSSVDSIVLTFDKKPTHAIDTTVSNYITIADRTFYASGQYSFTIPSEEGCDTIVDLNLHILDEPEAYDISPNPAKSIINVSSEDYISFVEFYSTAGRIVMRKEINAYQAEINVDELVPGVYFVRLYGEDVSLPSIQKFVKE